MKNYCLVAIINLACFVNAQNSAFNNGLIFMHPGSSFACFGDFQNDGNFSGSGGELILSGTNAQIITGTGTTEPFDVRINNTSATGITLSNTDIMVQNNVLFVDGQVHTTTTGQIIFKDNSTSTGASSGSFIEGPVSKIGNENFIFPTGNSGNYNPISISSPSIVNDRFTATYFNTDPIVTFGSPLEPGINHASTCEYWILERAVGTSQVDVTLGWNMNSCGISLLTDLLVIKWDSTQWVNYGNGGTSGTTSLGNVVTLNSTNNFGVFTLGSLTLENVLPIELLNFYAIRADQKVNINWETASESENDFFIVERSADGIVFENIALLDAAGNSSTINYYSTSDDSPIPGVSYYRLKQTDMNGEISFSETRSVIFEVDLTICPNPSDGKSLNVLVGKKQSTFKAVVIDINGNEVYNSMIEFDFEDAICRLELNFSDNLTSGIYTLLLYSNDEILKSVFVVL